MSLLPASAFQSGAGIYLCAGREGAVRGEVVWAYYEVIVSKYLHQLNKGRKTSLALEPSNWFTLLLNPVICAPSRNITL
jgi:hypothetical protein